MKRTLQHFLTVASALFASFMVGQAATYTWTGSTSSDWSNPDNWNPSGVPGAADTAIINSGTADLTSDAVVGTVEMRGGTVTGVGSLTVSNRLVWSNGTMTGPGALVIPAGVQWELAPWGGSVILDGRNRFYRARYAP